MRPLSKQVIFGLIGLLVVLAIFSNLSLGRSKTNSLSMSGLAQEIQTGGVKGIEVNGSALNVTLSNDTTVHVQKESDQSVVDLLSAYGITPEQLRALNISVKETSGRAYFTSVLLPSLLPLIIFAIIFFFLIRQLQGANNRAMSFGQSGARETSADAVQVTFADVAGAREAKEELMEEVEFLKNPKKFTDLGAKIPKGVLLMGPPGTGKTLLARAVAGEAGAPFYHISGSEFVEMFVGVGAARVRDLFAKAKKTAPCIIFIDEIDAVGRQRGSGLGGSHDEREQTLNQILVEMDGFDPHLGVIVIAATNRPDVLDPALLRPGRFDRRVVIDMPDKNERKEILEIHAKNKPLASDVQLERVAQRTVGFSGADLMNLLNEAAIRAARADRKEVLGEDVLESIEKVLLGPVRKSYVLSEQEKKITAYHEGGHALVAKKLSHADPVHKISIVSRGRAAGYTLKLPDHDKKMESRKEFLDDLAVLLGGYAAERLVFGDLTTGPSDDLKRATQLARRMVTRYGMSDALGPRTFGEQEELIFLGREIHESRDYSDAVAERIDGEVGRLIHDAITTATELLQTHRDQLDLIAKTLIEKETIEKDEFDALLA